MFKDFASVEWRQALILTLSAIFCTAQPLQVVLISKVWVTWGGEASDVTAPVMCLRSSEW